MGLMGKLLGSFFQHELMIVSPETLMMISSLRLLLGRGEGGIDKLDIDSRPFEVNLG